MADNGEMVNVTQHVVSSPSVFVLRRLKFFCLVSLLSSAFAQNLLWKDLDRGPYQPGFRCVGSIDGTRTWEDPVPLASNQPPLPHLRPLRISIWFPTKRPGPRVSYGDYIRQKCESDEPAFSAFSSLIAKRDIGYLPGLTGTRPASVQELLDIPAGAYANAPAAPGRFPVVLNFMGLNDLSSSNVVLWEYLAAHGFVVITVPQLGADANSIDLGLRNSDIETQVRDMESALNVVRQLPFVDATRIAVVGHSIGGINAVLLAMRNNDVKAVVTLDASFSEPLLAPLMTQSAFYSPERLSVPLLDVRRESAGSSHAVDAFSFSSRISIVVDGVLHGDFTSTPVVESLFPANAEGRSAESARGPVSFYLSLCRMIERFLGETMMPSRSRTPDLCQSNQLSGVKVVSCMSATPRPTLKRLAQSVLAQGLVGTVSQFNGELSEERMNALGYLLAGAGRLAESVEVLTENVTRHPESANTYDSLAEIQTRAGDLFHARQNYQSELRVINNDSTLPAGDKQRTQERVHRALEALAPKRE